ALKFQNLIIPSLREVYNSLWQSQELPKEFNESIIVMISKTAGQSSQDTLRLISLFNWDRKILTKCITNRLSPIIAKL
ncbi:hypothetical protein MHU76_32515, partial [Pseudomonas aeruginosa]|uniref:hypothetical protein n=1 Tax=Pseudomonas aeruginosa TaxID=287 RepID=UPI001F071024